MRVSIVIPTFNRPTLLSQTLLYLSRQKLNAADKMEVIVVDNGSTDSTPAVVEGFRTAIEELEYFYHPRDEHAPCVSSARNVGIQKSSGDVITFLDGGILVPPDFVANVARRHACIKKAVLIHYTFGICRAFFTESKADDAPILDALSPNTLDNVSRGLQVYPEWADPREGYFDSVDDNLDLLPAPWTLGWSCALTVPQHLAQRVGGFDESFHRWGVEDVDFCHRLYREGASFVAARDCFAFHLPHPVASTAEESNRENLRQLHRKNYRFETELFWLYDASPYVNQVLGRFNHLVIAGFIPQYPPLLLSRVKSEFIARARHSLLIGIDSTAAIRQLDTTHVFVCNEATLKRLQLSCEGRSIVHLLGTDTPYEDQFFDIVIVSDFLRMLGHLIREQLLREICRISKRVIILYTKDYVSRVRRRDDWPWVSIRKLRADAEKLGLIVEVKDVVGSYSILTVICGQPRAAANSGNEQLPADIIAMEQTTLQ